MKKSTYKITLLIAVVSLFSACKGDLKKNYSCKCDDLWSKIKGNTYDDFVKAWGSPMDEDQQWEKKEIGYKWQIDGLYECSGSSACGEIWVWFEGAQHENGKILPMGKVDHANCYNGGNEKFRHLLRD